MSHVFKTEDGKTRDTTGNVSLENGSVGCPLQEGPPCVYIQEQPFEMECPKGKTAATHSFHAVDESPAGGDFKWRVVPQQRPTILSIEGSSTVREVRVTPQNPGTATLRLDYNYEGRSASQSLTLTVRGVPKMAVSPEKKDFDEVVASKGDVQERFRIKNDGNGPLSIQVKPLEGEEYFLIQHPQPLKTPLPPGEDTTFVVQFKPDPEGKRTGKIQIASDDPDAREKVINLQGTGVQPVVDVRPVPAEFAAEVNKESAPQVFEVRNTGSGSLEVKKIEPQANTDFKINIKGSLYRKLRQGQQDHVIAFEVVFQPKSLGTKTTNVLISSNAGDKAVEIPIEGLPLNLARPKFKFLWGKTESGDGHTSVEQVGIKLARDGVDYDFGSTGYSGSAVELPSKAGGLKEGSYELKLTDPNKMFITTESPFFIDIPEGFKETRDVVLFKVARPTILVHSDGPAKDVQVMLRRQGSNSGDRSFTNTDKNGRAFLAKEQDGTEPIGLPPGKYDVFLKYPPNNLEGKAHPPTVIVDEGFTGTKSVDLIKLARPTIEVVWGGSNRIEGVKVTLKKDGADYDFGETNRSGEAKLPTEKPSLEKGLYQVLLSNYDRNLYIQPENPTVLLESGFEGTKTVDLIKVVKPEINVVSMGTALKGLKVTLKKGSLERTFVPTDDGGLARLADDVGGLPLDEYQVSIDHDALFFTLPQSSSKLDLRRNGPLTIELIRLARPQIEVVWGRTNPVAVAGVGITVRGTEEHKFGTTDDTGVIKLPDTVKGLTGNEQYHVELTYNESLYALKKKQWILRVAHGFEGVETIELVKLARPQIKITCGGQGVPGIGVKLRMGTEERDPGPTDDTGLVKFPDNLKGFPEGTCQIEPTYDKAKYTVKPNSLSVPLKEGFEEIVPVELEYRFNSVTPKIDVEYKVVLLDRNLAQYQVGETAIYADPTCIELSLTQTNDAYPYKHGATFTSANVDVYLDEPCTQKLTGDITDNQLSPKKKLKLYLKGTQAGTFKASLKLIDPKDTVFQLGNDAEVDMAVVPLEMELFHHDAGALAGIQVDPDTDPVTTYYTNLENTKLSGQAMTDEGKVKNGRLLHLQKGGNFGRARLICKKLDRAQWPPDTDEYQVVITATNTHGEVEIYDAESGGSKQALPVKIRAGDLKDDDKELWVQGAAVTTNWREVRLDMGLDRTGTGGLAKKPKRNGDWARFTVVEITEVKVEQPPGGRAPWDEKEGKFYINLKPDLPDRDGRKVTIGAQLNPKLENVTVHFMLAPDKNNGKTGNWKIDFSRVAKRKVIAKVGPNWNVQLQDIPWKDIPEALKHLDKSDRKNLLHVSATTDAKGYASKEVVLSRFGGDKFYPAAYIDQDPHLARYVHGHSELKKKKPVFAAESITIWRKVWYQMTRPAGTALPAVDGFTGTQQKVFVEPIVLEKDEMDASKFTEYPYRPQWQFNPALNSDDDKLCIGTHNVGEAMALFVPAPDFSPKFHVIVCEEQFDAWDRNDLSVKTDVQIVELTVDAPKEVKILKATGVDDDLISIIYPPLQGGDLIVSANWEALEKQGMNWIAIHKGKLEAGEVNVVKGRSRNNKVQVSPPALCFGNGGGCPCGGAPVKPPIDGTHKIQISLRLQAAAGPYAGWAPHASVANVAKIYPQDFKIQDTIAHELGHLFHQVRWQDLPPLPDHPKMYQQRGGSGTHCANNAAWNPDNAAPPLDPTTNNELDAQGNQAGRYANGNCILFGISGSTKTEWCEYCAFEWIVSDLSSF